MSTAFAKWLKRQGNFNTLQELYAIVLEGNHGIGAVKAWIDGKKYYDDSDLNERVIFLMDTPEQEAQ